MSDASGRLIPATSGNRVVAVALTSAAGADELIAVKVVGAAGALLA